jgi:hypothetical protein
METAAVPARRWPALLADLALVPALPVALFLAAKGGWGLASVVGAVALAFVFLVGRGTYDAARTGLIVSAAFLYLAVFGFIALLDVGFTCPEPTRPWVAFVAAGAVLLGLTLLSIWRRFLWGIPLAILLAFVVFVAVYSKLPAIPMDCAD